MGTPLDRHNVWRYFSRALKRAGLPHIRQHDLRHACASLLYSRGVDLGTISEILGHSGIQITTDLYPHVLPSLRRNAAELMDAGLAASR